MAYAPANLLARDRVRRRVGDTADPALLEGDEDAYDALIALFSESGVTVTWRGEVMDTAEAYATAAAADTLAAQIRRDARSLGSAGDSLTLFDPSDLDRLAAALRTAAEAAEDAAVNATPLTFVPVTYRPADANRDEFSR